MNSKHPLIQSQSVVEDTRTDVEKMEAAMGTEMRRKVKLAYEAKIALEKAKLEEERNAAQ